MNNWFLIGGLVSAGLYFLSSPKQQSKPIIVLCDGNSLTAGTIPGQPPFYWYPKELARLLGKQYKVDVSAIVGISTPAMIKNFKGKFDIVVFWEGTNHLMSASAETVYNTIVQYCQTVHMLGSRVVVVTILPFNSSQEINEKRLAVNKLTQQNWESFADSIADVTISVLTDPSNPQYYHTDKLHLNEAGSKIVAKAIAEAITSMKD